MSPKLRLILITWILWILGASIMVNHYFTKPIVPSTHTKIPSTSSHTGVSVTTGCRIITLGDSLTAGYNLDVSEAYPAQLEKLLRADGYPCTVVNAGISGDTSKAMLDRLDFTLGNEPYNLAILTIGGNDGLEILPVEDLRKNIIASIEKLKSKNIPIVLTGMQIPNNAGTYAQEFKKIYPEIATEQGVSYYPFFLEWVAMDPHYSLSDGIHPNATGYGIVAKNLYEFFKKEKLLDTLPKDTITP